MASQLRPCAGRCHVSASAVPTATLTSQRPLEACPSRGSVMLHTSRVYLVPEQSRGWSCGDNHSVPWSWSAYSQRMTAGALEESPCLTARLHRNRFSTEMEKGERTGEVCPVPSARQGSGRVCDDPGADD